MIFDAYSSSPKLDSLWQSMTKEPGKITNRFFPVKMTTPWGNILYLQSIFEYLFIYLLFKLSGIKKFFCWKFFVQDSFDLIFILKILFPRLIWFDFYPERYIHYVRFSPYLWEILKTLRDWGFIGISANSHTLLYEKKWNSCWIFPSFFRLSQK